VEHQLKEQKNQRSHAEEKLQKLYKQERELRHELETERKSLLKQEQDEQVQARLQEIDAQQ
jgi:hypothetical protein